MKPIILFLGHGSRAPGAVAGMQMVADALCTQYGIDDLLVCQMEGLGLSLPAAIAQAYGNGFREMLVQPYFLHAGNHLLLDIPELLAQAQLDFPDVHLHLGRHLGSDPALAGLVHRRIQESLLDFQGA